MHTGKVGAFMPGPHACFGTGDPPASQASIRPAGRGCARPAWGLLAGLLLGSLWVLSSPPAAAEPRSVLGLHVAGWSAPFTGLELERERADATAWVVGLSLEPPGFYGGARRYTRLRGDRPFYGAIIGLAADGTGYATQLRFSGGYEVRFDAQVRGTAQAGFHLHSTGEGRLRSGLFIAFSMGWQL